MDATAERSLLLWVQGFQQQVEHDQTISSIEDLSDGVFLARLLHHIDSEYIEMEQIHIDTSSNWALNANNLKILCRAIELYYLDEIGQACEPLETIDTTLIAKEKDRSHICRLIQVLLGCAVQCRHRSDYIHPIMQMDDTEQASMMHMIENLMQRPTISSPSATHRLSTDAFDWMEKLSQLETRVVDIETEKRHITEQLEIVMEEKEKLQKELKTMKEEREKVVQERQMNVTRDHQKIQEMVQNEVHVVTIALEEKKEELNRVKRESNERLQLLEQEVRRQADELDISRSKITQLGKLEASVAKYKKKLEEMNGLRTQVHDLETHNAQYLDKILELESSLKTIPALKSLVEKYKNQVVELETVHVETTSNCQIKEQKIRRLQEELDSMTSGKEFLESQVEELRTQVESFSHPHGESEGLSMDTMLRPIRADSLLGSDSMTSLKEQIVRLERENQELKKGDQDGQHTHLLNELDMAQKAKENLQMTLMEYKQQNENLMEQLEQHQKTSSPAKLSVVTAERIVEYEKEITRLRTDVEMVESMRATVTELTNRLKDKESVINELSEQRAKLENYTKKTLHAVQTKYMVAVSSHRNQINEKQERVDFLEKKLKEIRTSYAREQALMMSSFYEVGAEMQRRTMMPQAPGQANQPVAWLASKRTEERAKRRQI